MATKRRLIGSGIKTSIISPRIRTTRVRTAPLIEQLKRLDTELPPDERTAEEKEILSQPFYALHK